MEEKRKIIALALLSGGLDSALAARIIADITNILVVGYYFHHPFSSKNSQKSLEAVELQAASLGIPLIVDSDHSGFIEMVKCPLHGRGKGANPCRDCKIYILRRAMKVLNALGGDFLVSGEVVGQRPMSQLKHELMQIEKLAEVRGILLRPLSGAILPPTLPETEGWVPRERLFDISGRGRTRQLELAETLGVTKFSMPAGGCLLTEVEFSKKIFDLFENRPDFGPFEVEALKFGRHFRLKPDLKLIIARDDSESEKVLGVLGGRYWILTTSEVPGPYAALDRKPSQVELPLIAGIVAGYSKARDGALVAIEVISPDGKRTILEVEPLDKRNFQAYLL